MTGPMAKWAPGHSRSTAWARTWAVEWRRTSRPSGVVAVTTVTSAPSGSSRDRSTGTPSKVAATAALASRGPIDSANWRAVVPGSNSLVLPSGSRTVTPAMGGAFR